jgi:alkanesulfonate monooxygenase SsuD/methylene tetrahydromethanopterin reductase-like flavin-dependent oxidoreductase (luciferase family)
MTDRIRFEAFMVPSTSWRELLRRFELAEALGFDLAGTADHFVDWTAPSNPWFDFWTVLAAVAQVTRTIHLRPTVAQIPLRDPATFARQAISLDHISDGRFEIGIGIGLEIDPSYRMMGIPNWTAKERVARLKEYLEVLDSLLSNEITTYEGKYYSVHEAAMNPRPVRSPRPPIALAAMGPVMLRRAARYADIWNSLSFAETFDAQLAQTRERLGAIDDACASIGRDPASLRRSYTMLDMAARTRGGRMSYYESEDAFADRVERIIELGITEIGMYYPAVEAQQPMFERIATDVIPRIKAAHA